MTESPNWFNSLPTELKYKISDYLSSRNLLNLRLTNKETYKELEGYRRETYITRELVRKSYNEGSLYADRPYLPLNEETLDYLYHIIQPLEDQVIKMFQSWPYYADKVKTEQRLVQFLGESKFNWIMELVRRVYMNQINDEDDLIYFTCVKMCQIMVEKIVEAGDNGIITKLTPFFLFELI